MSNGKPIYTQFIFMYFEMDVIRFYYFTAKEFRIDCFSVDSHSIWTNQLPIYWCSVVHAEKFTWRIKRANILTCSADNVVLRADNRRESEDEKCHRGFCTPLSGAHVMTSFRCTARTNSNSGWQHATHQIDTWNVRATIFDRNRTRNKMKIVICCQCALLAFCRENHQTISDRAICHCMKRNERINIKIKTYSVWNERR